MFAKIKGNHPFYPTGDQSDECQHAYTDNNKCTRQRGERVHTPIVFKLRPEAYGKMRREEK